MKANTIAATLVLGLLFSSTTSWAESQCVSFFKKQPLTLNLVPIKIQGPLVLSEVKTEHGHKTDLVLKNTETKESIPLPYNSLEKVDLLQQDGKFYLASMPMSTRHGYKPDPAPLFQAQT